MAKYIVNSIVCALSLGLLLASNHVQVRADISVAEEILSVPHGALSEIIPLIPITNTHVPEAAMDLFQDYADKLHQAYGDLKDGGLIEDVAHTFLENLGPLSSAEITPQALEDMAESLHRKYDISLDSAKQAILLIRKMQLLPSSLREYEVPHLNFIPALPPIAGINLEDYASKLQQAYEDHASKLYQVYEDLTNGVSKEEVAQTLMDNLKELTSTHEMDLGELSQRMSPEAFHDVADSLHDRYDSTLDSAKQAIQLIKKISSLPSAGLDELFSGMKSRAGLFRTGSPPPPSAPIYSPSAFDQIAAYASGLQQAYAGLKEGVPRAEVAHSLLGTLKEMASAHGTSLAALTANVMPLNLGNISESLHDKYDVGFDSAKQAIQQFRKLSPLPQLFPNSEGSGLNEEIPPPPTSIHSIPESTKLALDLIKEYASKLRQAYSNLKDGLPNAEEVAPEVLEDLKELMSTTAMDVAELSSKLVPDGLEDMTELLNGKVDVGLDSVAAIGDKFDVGLDFAKEAFHAVNKDSLFKHPWLSSGFTSDIEDEAHDLIYDILPTTSSLIAAPTSIVPRVSSTSAAPSGSSTSMAPAFPSNVSLVAFQIIDDYLSKLRQVYSDLTAGVPRAEVADSFLQSLQELASSVGMDLTNLCAAILPLTGKALEIFDVKLDSLASIGEFDVNLGSVTNIGDMLGANLDAVTIGDIFGPKIHSLRQEIQIIRDLMPAFPICPSS